MIHHINTKLYAIQLNIHTSTASIEMAAIFWLSINYFLLVFKMHPGNDR